MVFQLTLPDQSVAAAATRGKGGDGHTDAVMALKDHPLAKEELKAAKGQRCDALHLSQFDDTNYVAWMGRFGDGQYYPVGRFLEIIQH